MNFISGMLTGPQPSYGGLQTGLLFAFIGIYLVGWFLIELNSYIQNKVYTFDKVVSFVGIAISLIVSFGHFGSLVKYLIINGL